MPALAVAFVAGAGVGAGAIAVLTKQPKPALEETRFLNFDAEGTSLEALASGWGEYEHNDQHDTFVWCTSSSCVLAIQAHGQRDRAIRLRTWAFRFQDAPKQEITVTVGNTLVGMHELGDAAETWEVLVPSSEWKDGQNLIRFDFGYTESPSKHGTPDLRTLSVAFDWLEVLPQ